MRQKGTFQVSFTYQALIVYGS